MFSGTHLEKTLFYVVKSKSRLKKPFVVKLNGFVKS